MDDFDRRLEFQLRRRLDPVVAAPVPPRRGKAGSARLIKRGRAEATTKATGGYAIDLRSQTLVFVDHS